MKDIATFLVEFGIIVIVMGLVWLMLCQVIEHIREEIQWRRLKDE